MKRTPGLWHIVLGLLLIVTYVRPAEWHTQVWDERLVPPARSKQYHTHAGIVSAGPGGWRSDDAGGRR
mgnify:CR=1 FL=1